MTTLLNLPPSVIKRLSRQTRNSAPYTMRVGSNGKVTIHPVNHNFSKDKIYGNIVRPLNVLSEVHPVLRKTLRKKKSTAWPLRGKLDQNTIDLINKMGCRKLSPMKLPETHYPLMKYKSYFKLYTDKTNASKMYKPKSEYIPVKRDEENGILKRLNRIIRMRFL